MDRNLKLGLLGLVVAVVGTVGTYIPVLGQRVIWVGLAVAGTCLAVYFIYSLLREVREIVSTFGSRWRLVDGRLKIGNTINVALRACTIQTILRCFETSPNASYVCTLKHAGLDSGGSFAKELRAELIQRGQVDILKSGKTNEIVREKLSLWARYDSSTGMGLFDVTKAFMENDLLRGQITVRNCFLSYDRHEAAPTCSFMEGYIEGVLLHLLGIDVTVRETSCSSVTGKGQCVFEFTPKLTGRGQG